MLSQIAATWVQKYDYTFNVSNGNLSLRKNVLKDKTENFFYDGNLDCFGAALAFIQSGQPPQVVAIGYPSEKNGNILTKSDAGTFAYIETPYAVSEISNHQNISSTP
jgi:hypothetical protein